MSFLGYLIQAKPPVICGGLCRVTLHHVYYPFEALSTFSKVTRVMTLAPHEGHLYHSSERRYLTSWR